MDVSTMILHRTGEPSKQDSAPYGSVCVVKNHTQTSLYIQLGHDTIRWEYMGEFKADITDQEIVIEKLKVLYPDS
jgi:hypothetical protein